MSGEMSNAKLYARLRPRLMIDKLSLDDELIDMPTLLHEALEAAANATTMRDEAKRELDYISADVGMTLRNQTEKKPTEGQVSQLVTLDQDVVTAVQKFDDAKSNLAFWQTMVNGLEAKQTSLKGLVQLASLGYFTVNSAIEERRAELSVKRKALKEDR